MGVGYQSVTLPCGREGVLSPAHRLGSPVLCSCSGERSDLESSLWTCRCHTSRRAAGQLARGFRCPVVVYARNLDASSCEPTSHGPAVMSTVPVRSPPHLPGLLCPTGPVQLLALPALVLSWAASWLRGAHPVATDHRWHWASLRCLLCGKGCPRFICKNGCEYKSLITACKNPPPEIPFS